MNDLMSAGIHRLWKRFTIELSAVRPGQTVLDIAGGTGDLSARFSTLVGAQGRVILADINASMLAVGRDKLLDAGAFGNLHMVQCDAQTLPFPDNSIDCITIAFGLRNVTDKHLALAVYGACFKAGRAPSGVGVLQAHQRIVAKSLRHLFISDSSYDGSLSG